MAKKASKNQGFIDTLEDWFDKVPSLPKNGREMLVKITPWIALIFGILGILASVSGLGLLTAASPFAALSGASAMSDIGGGFITTLIWLVASVVLLAAFPGTKARKMGGWSLLFWSQILHLVGSFVGLQFVSGLIGAAIGLYLIFQIKPYYK